MHVNLIKVLNPILLAILTENIVTRAAGKAIIATGIVLYFIKMILKYLQCDLRLFFFIVREEINVRLSPGKQK